MIEMDCACGKQQALWITVDNPVDKPIRKTQHAMPLDLKTKCLGFDSDIQQAMFEAVDLLNARLDALEADISTILGILNSPLDPSMAIERLRILMEQYP